jgi:hypothetical protein
MFVTCLLVRHDSVKVLVSQQRRSLVCNYTKEICRIPQGKKVQTASWHFGTELSVCLEGISKHLARVHFMLQAKDITAARDGSIVIPSPAISVFKTVHHAMSTSPSQRRRDAFLPWNLTHVFPHFPGVSVCKDKSRDIHPICKAFTEVFV